MSFLDILFQIGLVIATVFGTGILVLLFRWNRTGGSSQAELMGRLTQLAESNAAQQTQLAERLQAQERSLSKTLDERLTNLTHRIGQTLQQSSTKTGETMAKLQERLAVIDAAQKNITELSGKVVGLQDILSNKQARGTFGEIQLQDLVQNALPPSAYAFQVTLSNGRRADCLINLPNPPGSIAIDAKFPLESYRMLVNADTKIDKTTARRQFTTDILKHVSDISKRYIVHGETAESALMFLPSEAVYAELHANFVEVIEKSYSFRVWIVSPTTLMATLNTVRAILKDAQMREQADVIQQEVMKMLRDVARLDQRVENLEKHFSQAEKDLKGIRVSAEKVTNRGERITEIELSGSSGTEETENNAISSNQAFHQIEK